MRTFKSFVYVSLALTAVLFVLLLGWKLVLAGERPGTVVKVASALLILYAGLCLFTLAAIKKGRGGPAAKIWTLVFSLIFFYVLLDVVGGILFMRPAPFRNSPDSYAHHKMLPEKEYLMFNPFDYEVKMTTNKMGFRGRDPGGKRADVYRIVMVGDSFTMGEGVADDEAFPLIVEEILNDRAGPKYEVINLGVESYTPILEYLNLKTHIETLKPDLVIMNFDMSDLVGEYIYLHGDVERDEQGNITAVDGYPEYNRRHNSPREKIATVIRSRLFITGALMTRLYKQAETDLALNGLDVRRGIESKNFTLLMHTLDAPQPPETEEMYGMIEDSILKAKLLCDSHGSEFILTVYPWGHQVSAEEWVPGRHGLVLEGAEVSDRTVERLEKFSAANGIVFFNAFPAFRSYAGDAPLYFNHDMHFAPAGHMLMAESLAGFLEGYLGEGRGWN